MTIARDIRRLRLRRSGSNDALELVEAIAAQWEAGLPLRVVRKFLRKRGIHAWSLLVPLVGDSWVRMAMALDVPRWVIDANLAVGRDHWDRGFRFSDLPTRRRLPEGLVARWLKVLRAPGLLRLPKNLWAERITLQDCPSLRLLRVGHAVPTFLTLIRCRRIESLSRAFSGLSWLTIQDCHSFQSLPRLRRARFGSCNLRLKNLPTLVEVSDRSVVSGLLAWHCPTLVHLRQVTLIGPGVLTIYGCLKLETLPKCGSLSQLEVMDCPSLGEQMLPKASESHFYRPLGMAQGRWPAFTLPPCAMPQDPEPVPLMKGICARLEAWPWPPDPPEPSCLEPAMVRTMGVLHLQPYDQIQVLTDATTHQQSLVRAFLRLEADPGRAVDLAASLLGTAADLGDRVMAAQVLAEMESMGLGALSPLWHLDPDRMARLGPGLLPRWPNGIGHVGDMRSFIDERGVVASPIVSCVGNYGFMELLNLREVRNPIWSRHAFCIRDCPSLEVLPDLLVVQDELVISDCPSLRSFPQRLEVRGDLAIHNLPRLQAQVCRIRVGGEVHLEGVPGLKLIPLDTP